MKAAIMGYGTIGSGVYEVLDKNCKSVEKKAGEPIEVKYILDLREFPGSPVEKLVIHDVEQIVNDPEIGIPRSFALFKMIFQLSSLYPGFITRNTRSNFTFP